MTWFTLLQSLGVATAAFAAIAWVAREVALRWLDNRVEVFREQLRRDSIEHQIRFESLHAKRAEAVILIWRAIRHAQMAVDSFVHPAQMGGRESQDKKGEVAGDRVVELNRAVLEHSIFFPEDLAKRIECVSKELDALWFGAYLDYREARDESRNPYFGGGESSEFGKAWKKLKAEIHPLIPELESELRQIIGV